MVRSTCWASADIFAVLFEYGPESLGRRLFARQGMPRSVGPADFRPYTLRRGLGGQSGTQWFFTEAGGPSPSMWCSGATLGRDVLVPRVNELLARLAIAPAGQPPALVGPPFVSPGGAPWN